MAASNQFKQTSGRALLAFALSAALVAAFTAVEAGRRADLEGTFGPTALGDTDWFDAEADVDDPLQPLFTSDGQPIYRHRSKLLRRYDKYMNKVARDDGDRYFLYQYELPRSGAETLDGVFFLKVGNGSYLEVGFEPRERTPAPEPEI